MHIVIQPIRRRSVRKVYLPHERIQVNGVGLGEVDGLYNLGKMFSRMFHFTPKSFQFKNIVGSIGSVALTGATLGLAPKISSAHSKISKGVGTGIVVAAAAVGAGYGLSAMSPGLLSSIGSGISSFGSGVMKFVSGGGMGIMGMFRGGSGGSSTASQEYPPGYGGQGVVQVPQYYDPTAAYNENVARSAGAPLGGAGESYQSQPPNANYSQPPIESQLLSPDKDSLQYPQAGMIDPATGQVIPIRVQQAGMFPDLSMTTWLVIGGVTLAGWYLMSDSKKEISNG